MPVSFLTEDQRSRYARFAGEPSPEQLARYFYLDERDRRIVNQHRGDHSRLGFATQLCTARFLGTFLDDLAEVPPGVIAYLARQLYIDQLSGFLIYRQSETRWDHAAEIREHCGFREYSVDLPLPEMPRNQSEHRNDIRPSRARRDHSGNFGL